MTLLEAVASGKPFRIRGSGNAFIEKDFAWLTISRENILSGDWETSKEMVMIDREELDALKAKAAGADAIRSRS